MVSLLMKETIRNQDGTKREYRLNEINHTK